METVHKRYGAYLPHWTTKNGIYAVGFRLADSLPRKSREQIIAEREDIVQTAKAMGRELAPKERLRLIQLKSSKVEKFLHRGYGECWLKQDRIASIVASAFNFFNGSRYKLYAWCIMPNHVHIIVQPHADHSLSSILHSWKSFTAKQANVILGRIGSFWIRESYDHVIRNADDLRYQIEYAWSNPEMAGMHNWKWRWRIEDEELEKSLAHLAQGAAGLKPAAKAGTMPA